LTLGVAVLATCLGTAPVAARPVARIGPTAAVQPTEQTRTITVKKDAVIGVRLDRPLTTETARVNDRVTARVARDVMVDDRTALVAGTRVQGYVAAVERSAKPTDHARIGIRFTALILADDRRVPIQVDTVFRESEPAGEPPPTGAGSALSAFLSSGASRTGAASRNRPSTASGTPSRDVRIPAGALLTMKLTGAVTIER
jgi:hypothetical protein